MTTSPLLRICRSVLEVGSSLETPKRPAVQHVRPVKWNRIDTRAYYIPRSQQLPSKQLPPAVLGLYHEACPPSKYPRPIALSYWPPTLYPQNLVAKGFFAYVQDGQNLLLTLHANPLHELLARSPTRCVLARLQWLDQDFDPPDIPSEIVFRDHEKPKHDGLSIPFKILPAPSRNVPKKPYYRTLLKISYFIAELLQHESQRRRTDDRPVIVNHGQYRAGASLPGLEINLMLIRLPPNNEDHYGLGTSTNKRKRDRKARFDLIPSDELESDDEDVITELQTKRRKKI